MKKILGIIVSLIMMFSVVGCANNNTNSLPINPDSSNSKIDNGVNSDEEESSDNTTMDDESSRNDSSLGEENESSINNNEDESSSKSEGWTGCF